jgi:hypothetical protein
MIQLKIGTAYLTSHLIHMLTRDELVIPEFQRPYVWTLPDVALLVDSIVREYPIGNLVFLQLITEDPTGIPRRASPWSLAPDQGGSRWPLYVLDGQQRLLSVIKLFLTGEFQVVLPVTATRTTEACVVRAEDVNLDTHFNVTQILWDSSLRGRHHELRARLGAADPWAAVRVADPEPGLAYSHTLSTRYGDTPALHVAFALADRLRAVDLPYYNLEVRGDSSLREAVAVFKRLNMSGVPVDIEYLESL